jgi:hypothetical protein
MMRGNSWQLFSLMDIGLLRIGLLINTDELILKSSMELVYAGQGVGSWDSLESPSGLDTIVLMIGQVESPSMPKEIVDVAHLSTPQQK